MPRAHQKTKTEILQDIVNDYIAAGEPWPADRMTIAAWAYNTRRWLPPRTSAISQCAEELAAAMRAETVTDPQGRTVRAKHCVKLSEIDERGKKTQKTLWFDHSTWTPDLMRTSLQQRRRGILGDCTQLRTDQDSFNENNQFGADIRISLDFEEDLNELQHPEDYSPTPPPRE